MKKLRILVNLKLYFLQVKFQSFKLFSNSGELSAVGDDARGSGGTLSGANRLKGIENVEAIGDSAENGVLAIEPVAGDEGHEELGAVGVGTGIGHGQVTSLGVLDGEVLIVELVAVDGLATSAVASGEITTLGHELSDYSVEGGSFVVERLTRLAGTLLTSAEASEVLSSFGSLVSVELHGDSAGGLTTDGNIKENNRVWHNVFNYKKILRNFF